MLASILGARLRWHERRVDDVGPDDEGLEHPAAGLAGRHAVQHIYYQRVAPGIETTAWYEERGSVVHITWYLKAQTTHRFAAVPAWLAKDFTAYRGDNQDPAFSKKIRELSSQGLDWPRTIRDNEGYFEVL
jgi:hypothetical protein